MKKILFLLCLIPSFVFAEHHRIHIIEAMDGDKQFPYSILYFVNGSRQNLDHYLNNVTLIEQHHINRMNSVYRTLQALEDRTNRIRTALLNHTESLDTLRLLIDQPKAELRPISGQSLNWQLAVAEYNLRHLIGVDPAF